MNKLTSKPQKQQIAEADSADLSAAIRELRRDLGLTQVQFAAEVEITPTTIYRYESGTNTPTNDILAKMLQLAVKKQSLAGVQNLAEHLAKRTGLNVFGGAAEVSGGPFSRALSGLRLERRMLIMAAVLMEKEASDETAMRVFEALVKPWIERASETFGPVGVAFDTTLENCAKPARSGVRRKENL